MDHQPLLNKKGRNKLQIGRLFLSVCAVGIGGSFQYGYNVSIINAPTKHIQDFINGTWYSRYQTELNRNLLTLFWSVIVSVFTLGGLLGIHIGGILAIRLGRKKTLLLNNFIAILAAFFMGIAYPTKTFELLIVGRFCIGINAGIGICTQPLYLGEIAPKQIRGLTTVGLNIFLTGGIFIGQLVGLWERSSGDSTWPLLLSTCCIPAILQLITFPWFPESPRYLLIERKDEYQGKKALIWLHGIDNYQTEMDDIQKEADALNGEKPKEILQLFMDRTNKWQLIIIILTNIGQQLSGINAIYFYSTYVFTKAGIPMQNIPYVTLGTGLCECITAMTCGLLIDYAGRRFLIIGGYTLMAFWCTVLTLTLTFQNVYPWVPYLSMCAVFAFILSFGMGPGGVTSVLTAELFTQSSRSAAFRIAGSVNWISFFTIGMVFPFIVNGLNQYCFLFFFVDCVLIASFIFFIVPETKNKSFLEIKREFQKQNFRQNYVDSTDEQDTNNKL
ncbi:hypothetical protein GDO86_001821 [Hymenochirus boettgeri]|uniref:Solute carrier family 2, facilitated glucose transporter member 5 n=1 Tax=Hymenochirus boettgeri TaxID=247094 RepID=A0A8T2KHJ2_9PIPI|nr:hypothetical protein GDO86_001821 [Hymenochirus boettgeri]